MATCEIGNPCGGGASYRQVPPTHTQTEFTVRCALLNLIISPRGADFAHVRLQELLKKSHNPRAAEFLLMRDDEAEAPKLTRQLAGGKTWAPLLSQLAASAQRPSPFLYPHFPASPIDRNLLLWLNSEEFLHFIPPHAISAPSRADQSALPRWLVESCTVIADSKYFSI